MLASLLLLAPLALATSVPVWAGQEAAEAEETPRVQIDFSDAPATRYWSEVGPDVAPAELPPSPWPAWEPDGSEDPWAVRAPWARWTALLHVERQSNAPHPHRRAHLAMLALAQGRYDDAWRHFEWARNDEATLVALMPSFFPGAPIGHPVEAHGLSAPLPAGVTLTPSLPPPRDGERSAAKSYGELKLERFQVGDAVLSLRLSHQPDGVQIDVEFVEGDATEVTLRFPLVPERPMDSVYLDWEEQGEVRREYTLTLSAEEQEHTLWGRFRPDPPQWPAGLPALLPAAARAGGVQIEVIGTDERLEARAGALAEACTRLLQIPVTVITEPEGDRVWAAPHVRVGAGHGTLPQLVSRIERFALRPIWR